jgi:hypothetical protein
LNQIHFELFHPSIVLNATLKAASMLAALGVFSQAQPQQPRRAEDRKAFDYIFFMATSNSTSSKKLVRQRD